MNAIALVIVLLSGQEMFVEAFPTAEECFAEAEFVVAMEESVANSHVQSIDCTWFKAKEQTWRTAFGDLV